MAGLELLAEKVEIAEVEAKDKAKTFKSQDQYGQEIN